MVSGRLPQERISAVEMFLGPDHMAMRSGFIGGTDVGQQEGRLVVRIAHVAACCQPCWHVGWCLIRRGCGVLPETCSSY